jgi:hypothetical protein
MKFSSSEQSLNSSVERVFNLCGNYKNLCTYLPPQVTNFEANEDSCTFTIQNMVKVTLSVAEKVEFERIVYVASNDKNIPISLSFFFKKIDENCSTLKIEMELEVPIFLRPMVNEPLEKFIQLMSEKIKMEVKK